MTTFERGDTHMTREKLIEDIKKIDNELPGITRTFGALEDISADICDYMAEHPEDKELAEEWRKSKFSYECTVCTAFSHLIKEDILKEYNL